MTAPTLPTREDGAFLVPSRFRDGDDRPRFVLPVPRLSLPDVAIRVLIHQERWADGYEAAPRHLFDAHLQPGDVFVDVGAHWGIFSLSAASRWPGEVSVLAVEPHPENVCRLMDAVAHNGFRDGVEIVAAACGERPGFARLRLNTSMGHTIAPWTPIRELPGANLCVPVVTLDDLFAERPHLQGRRVFLKVDVEGAETQVLAGARALLESGRVHAVMWEHGMAAGDPARRSEAAGWVRALEGLGFTSYHFPDDAPAPFRLAPLPNLAEGDQGCNVFSLGPGCPPLQLYGG